MRDEEITVTSHSYPFHRSLPAAAALWLLAAVGPALAQSQAPPAAAPAQPPAPATAPAPMPAPGAAPPASPVDPASYIIGPGDVVQIFVWRNPELSVQVPVRPDGKISTPLVEDMVAVGKTPSQLAREIEKVLAEYIRSPSVNVIVTSPASAFSQVKIVGQVARPQSIGYREGLTVLDVVLTVGGLTPFASGNKAKIVRKVDGKTVEIRVRLNDLMNKGDMKQNVDLKPGDVLVVPESAF